jgi:prevent-host-death family protein
MHTVSVTEIKRNFSTFINRVVSGRERIVLTLGGKPQAALIGLEDLKSLESLMLPSHSSSREQQRAALAMAQEVREMSLARRGGEPFPDVAENLQLLREKRDHELASLR